MSDRLEDLHPDLKPKAEALLQRCGEEHISIRITETWRSPEREDELHAKGITKATGATCKHCFMLDGKPASKAFDFALFRDGYYIANGEDELYTRVGEMAEAEGMKWGGRFSNPDYDHCEIA